MIYTVSSNGLNKPKIKAFSSYMENMYLHNSNWNPEFCRYQSKILHALGAICDAHIGAIFMKIGAFYGALRIFEQCAQ